MFWQMHCACGCDRLRRSKQRLIERPIGLILLPYRCEGCELRMFKLSWVPPKVTTRNHSYRDKQIPIVPNKAKPERRLRPPHLSPALGNRRR
jgi:hypothetical protein